MGLALTSWPKYMHDVRNTGVAEVDVKTDGTVKWKHYVGSLVYGSPVIGLLTVCFGAHDGYLYAVNQIDGSLLWRYATGGYIRSSPAVDDALVVYVKSSDGYLYAVNPDGSLRWRYYSGQFYKSHVNIVGNTVYFFDGQYLFAINRETGGAEWVYDAGAGFYFAGGPAVGEDGTIYVGLRDSSQAFNYLAAFDPNGSLKWQYLMGLYSAIVPGSPSVGADGTIYIHDGWRYVHAVNPDGSLKWKYQLDYDYISDREPDPPFVDAAGVYACDSGRIYRFGFDGTVLWKSDVLLLSGMAVVDASGKVYAVTGAGELVVFDSQGLMVGLYRIGHGILSPGAVGPDGVLYLNSLDYSVYAHTLSTLLVPGRRRVVNPMVLLKMGGVMK